MKHSRLIILAKEGLRLLRSVDPTKLEPVYGTSRDELTAALEAINTLTPPVEAVPISEDERPIAERFYAEIGNSIKTHSDYLTAGKASDYADYKRIVGVIAGLKRAAETYHEQLRIINEG